VRQKLVTAAPSQRSTHRLAAEKIGHTLGEVVADIVADLDNVEAADTRTVEEQQEDPTAEDQKACNHLHAVDCSYLEAPLWYDSRQ
jgi:hypothetical protein